MDAFKENLSGVSAQIEDVIPYLQEKKEKGQDLLILMYDAGELIGTMILNSNKFEETEKTNFNYTATLISKVIKDIKEENDILIAAEAYSLRHCINSYTEILKSRKIILAEPEETSKNINV